MMRRTAYLFAALPAVLVAAGSVWADGKVVQPEAKPGAPAAPPALQQPAPPVLQPGVQPGLPGLQPGQPFDPQKMQEMMQQQMAKALGLKLPPPALKWGGMVLEPANEALLDQLGVPAGEGMVIASVEADSAAAEAGLKKHDLVIKVNQQAVPGDAKELLKALGDAKADTPMELVVLRKGKEQTLKAVKLPKAALATQSLPGFGGPLGPGIAPVPLLPVPPLQPFPPPGGPGVGLLPGFLGKPNANFTGAKISINRNNNQFDGSYEKDKVHITIRGKVENNQAKADEITVDDGTETKKFKKLEEVPQAQRDTVSGLLQMVTGNTGGFGPPGLGIPNLPLPGVPPTPLAPPLALPPPPDLPK